MRCSASAIGLGHSPTGTIASTSTPNTPAIALTLSPLTRFPRSG
ncbi:hypothetical protein VB780_14765 [Leptolyngbya sp. CCNP1308]|nr:hypothetical protein [Leptolyngbya sp. CCNP1308]MEA5449843.1 hypothetical protein [Leptolyngbya sp. CCNP1308]